MEKMNNFEKENLNSPQLNDVIRKKYFRNQQPPNFTEDDKDKWRDPLFPPNESSLLSEEYKNGKLTPEQRERVEKEIDPNQVEWKRVSNEVKGDLHVFEEEIKHSDTESTESTESYFLASLEALTKFPNLIYHKSSTRDYSHGFYEVLMFIEGEWQIVLIDDYFPFEKGTDNLKFTRMKSNALWTMLLMKAWAKVNGGYANIVMAKTSDSKQNNYIGSNNNKNNYNNNSDNNKFNDDLMKKVLSKKEEKENSFKELSTLEKAESIDKNMNIFLQSINNDRINNNEDSQFEQVKEKYEMFMKKWKYNFQQSINAFNNKSKNISLVYKKRVSKELKKFGEPGDDLYTIANYKDKMQHSGAVTCMISFKYDGKILMASGGCDFSVKVWDPITGKKLMSFDEHTREITCLINIQTEGRNLIASGSGDKTVRLWEVDSKNCVGVLQGHTDEITCLINIQTEGRNLIASASGSKDKTVRLWDVDSKERVGELKGHNGEITSLINIQIQGRNVITSGSEDKTIRLWDVDSKECVGVLEGHTGGISCLINIKTEGRNLIASGCQESNDNKDKTIRLWDVNSKKCVGELYGHNGEISYLINIQTEGRNLIASGGGSRDNTVRLWDVDSKKCVGVLKGHKDEITCLINIKTAGRNLIASGGGESDKTVRLWDVYSQECVGVLEGHTNMITCLINIKTEGRNLIASGGGEEDKTVRLWDVDIRDYFNQKEFKITKQFIYESNGSLFLVIGYENGFIHVWKYFNNKCLFVAYFKGHNEEITCLINIKTAGSNLIASGGGKEDRTVRLWDVDSKECVGVLEGHTEEITCLINIKTAGRNLIASGGGYKDKTVRLWDVDSKECVGVLKGHTGDITCLINIKTAGRNLIASGSGYRDKTVRLWDVDGKECVGVLKGHTGGITCLINIKTDGRNLIASGGVYEYTVRLWDVDSKECVGVLEGHKDEISSLINIQTEGRKLIASASKDKTIRLWDVNSKECVGVLKGHTWSISCLINIQNEGRNLIASGGGGDDKTVRLWDVDSKKCVGELKGHTRGIICLINIQTEGRNLIASGGGEKDTTIRLWDVDSQNCVGYLNAYTGWEDCSKNNLIEKRKSIISESEVKTVRLWKAEFRDCFKENEFKITNLFAYEHIGSLFLVIGYEKGFIHVWKYFNNKCLFVAYFKGHNEEITCLINIKTEGRNLIASGCQESNDNKDNTIRLWDVDSKECVGVLEGHTDVITSLINIKSDGRNLIASASGSRDKTVRLWDVDSKKCVGVLKGHKDEITCLINIQTEGRNLIASGGGKEDKTIRLWDFDSQECLFTINSNSIISPQNLIHANGKIIYPDNSEIKVWNIRSEEYLKELVVDSIITFMINIPTEEKSLIAFSCVDKTLRIWNVKTGEVKTILNEVDVKSLDFSVWGKKRMIVVGLLRSIKVLDADSFQCILELKQKEEQLYDVICPSKLNEGKLLLISRWTKDVVRITLLSNFKIFKTEKGHKNYICSSPLFA